MQLRTITQNLPLMLGIGVGILGLVGLLVFVVFNKKPPTQTLPDGTKYNPTNDLTEIGVELKKGFWQVADASVWQRIAKYNDAQTQILYKGFRQMYASDQVLKGSFYSLLLAYKQSLWQTIPELDKILATFRKLNLN